MTSRTKEEELQQTISAYIQGHGNQISTATMFDASVINRSGLRCQMTYLGLALCGEAGEVGNALKKLLRKHGCIEPGHLSQDEIDNLVLELGDILWYVSAIAQRLGYTTQQVMQINDIKLTLRNAAGIEPGNDKTSKHLLPPLSDDFKFMEAHHDEGSRR